MSTWDSTESKENGLDISKSYIWLIARSEVYSPFDRASILFGKPCERWWVLLDGRVVCFPTHSLSSATEWPSSCSHSFGLENGIKKTLSSGYCKTMLLHRGASRLAIHRSICQDIFPLVRVYTWEASNTSAICSRDSSLLLAPLATTVSIELH